MIVIERVKRQKYRLIHILLFSISSLFVVMHSIFHISWSQLSLQGFNDSNISSPANNLV
jgi:hypothetical protein